MRAEDIKSTALHFQLASILQLPGFIMISQDKCVQGDLLSAQVKCLYIEVIFMPIFDSNIDFQ